MKLYISEIIDEAIYADTLDEMILTDEREFVPEFMHELEMHHVIPGQP
jgi:hypothetical protein